MVLVKRDDIKSIDELVDTLKGMENYSKMSRRAVRDMVTNYGKTSALNQDQIKKRIRKMKRIGKLLSGLEDVNEKVLDLF